MNLYTGVTILLDYDNIRIKSFVEGIIEIDGKEIILISTKSIFMIDNSILGGI